MFINKIRQHLQKPIYNNFLKIIRNFKCFWNTKYVINVYYHWSKITILDVMYWTRFNLKHSAYNNNSWASLGGMVKLQIQGKYILRLRPLASLNRFDQITDLSTPSHLTLHIAHWLRIMDRYTAQGLLPLSIILWSDNWSVGSLLCIF